MDELSIEQSERILAEQRVAHLGLVDDGEPYVTPLSYVVLDGDVYYRTGPGRRHDALASDPRVCVEVTRNDDAGWVSVIFWGEARVVGGPGRPGPGGEAGGAKGTAAPRRGRGPP
ncbi:MAG: pyridoxamine 5'-phosphate oxidase family protein, partial [Acidimicrobiia bacterium]|nr:pyridoxamine 5'-phosphate oxidase family protein [Acidimicrobiia bacterium]